MKSVGFKEWALVCDALGRGEQRVILRKGGIAEGRDGFGFAYREFFLFPTFFHEQLERVRTDVEGLPVRREGEIVIRHYVKVKDACRMDNWAKVQELEPLHILHPEVVRERFDYGDKPGLHVAFVETFCLAQPWILPEQRSFGGCRSWIELPEPPPLQLHRVELATA